jgi:hypothetical protein
MRQGLPYFGKGDAEFLCHTDDGESPQYIALVAPLVATRPARPDQAPPFVKVERGHRKPAPLGHLPDCQLSRHFCFLPLYLNCS